MRSVFSTEAERIPRRLKRWRSGRLASLAAAAALLAGCAGLGGDSAPAASDTGARNAVGSDNEVAGAVALNPDSNVPEAVLERYAQAVFLLETGDHQGAEAELRRFINDYPGYPGPHVNLGIIQAAQGREDEAMQSLERALGIDPASAAALNQVGILHRKAGRFAEAEAAYLKAITVKPDYALAHYNLGVLNDLYFGRLDQALDAYESYQALTPAEDPEVARWIVDLSRRVGRP